jgi:hypothetical protein
LHGTLFWDYRAVRANSKVVVCVFDFSAVLHAVVFC